MRAMILESDLSSDPGKGYVAKFILDVEKDHDGCYSLEFYDPVELSRNLRSEFVRSRWFEKVEAFIGEAVRHNAKFIGVPEVPPAELLRFVERNHKRLGHRSRALET